MNIKQQLNNSFFALFIGALLIGARDTNNLSHFDVQRILFFFFLFFFRLKMYLDDNNNFSNENLKMSSERKDFGFGYITTMLSWIIFPISAYRVWDETMESSILFLAIAICLLSLWTISAAFIVNPKISAHKKWFWLNIIYLLFLSVLYFVIDFLKTNHCFPTPWLINLLSYLTPLLLIVTLCYDYHQSNTIHNAKK